MKKYFPLSFKYSKDITSMLIGIIVYLAIAALAGVAIWVASLLGGWIPLAGVVIAWLLQIVSILVEFYIFAGIIILILAFLKIIKK